VNLNISTRKTSADSSLSATCSLSLVERVLVGRGLSQPESFELSSLHSWELLANIEAATDLLVNALEQSKYILGQHILVIGDYDADGATGTALPTRPAFIRRHRGFVDCRRLAAVADAGLV